MDYACTILQVTRMIMGYFIFNYPVPPHINSCTWQCWQYAL